MRLVQNIKLFFREGNSDKTYEVDLCEVAPDEYLVNFRYGRRGANLKEGTKTVFPVALNEAQKVYDKLVESKVKKGYSETIPSEETSTNTPEQTEDFNAVREATILKYLEQAVNGEYNREHWPLSKVLWRTGELRIKEAEKFLVKLQFNDNELFNYSLIWALGRCGGAAALIHIKELVGQQSQKTIWSNLSKFAIVQLASEDEKNKIAQNTQSDLPGELKHLNIEAAPNELSSAVSELLEVLKVSNTSFLIDLYLLACIRPKMMQALKSILSELPLRPPYFKALRGIFKAAEFNSDYATYGLLAKKIESTQAHYNTPEWGNKVYAEGRYIDHRVEQQKDESKLAFSSKTKSYLQKRVSRNLLRLSDVASNDFTKMATGYLLAYSNEDNNGPSSASFWDYSSGSWETITVHYPPYSEYTTFCYLLYANSPRIERASTNSKWKFKQGKGPQTAIPETREEAHPELWDKDGESLTTLLKESRCDLVLQFAIKAFQANPDQEKFYTDELAISLLSSKFEPCQQLGLSITKQLIESSDNKAELVAAALNCSLAEVRIQGINWLSQHKDTLLNNPVFITLLVCSKYADIHDWIDNNITISPETGQAVSKTIIGKVLLISETDDYSKEEIERITQTIFAHLSDYIDAVSFESIEKLLENERSSVRAFGVRLLINHKEGADGIPESIFEQLIADESTEVRHLGVTLFGQMSLSTLKTKEDVILSFALSQHQEIRQAALPIIEKLVNDDKAFGEKIAALLLVLIQEKEKHAGFNQDLLNIFKGPLQTTLSTISMNNTWALIEAFPIEASELGMIILNEKNIIHSLSVKEWVRLGNNELAALRNACKEQFKSNVSKVKYEAEDAVKLLDSPWEDTRTFAQAYFEEHFTQNEWTSELLINLCDSVKTETQDFGKQKITSFFRQEDGQTYLLKLSEHPNTNLQLFVSSYIEQYASDNFERIQQLEYFFVSALSQINQGRAVKLRLFKFLQEEALKNVEVAKWALPILERISLTIAIRDKAICMQAMLQISIKYPHLESILTIESPEVR